MGDLTPLVAPLIVRVYVVKPESGIRDKLARFVARLIDHMLADKARAVIAIRSSAVNHYRAGSQQVLKTCFTFSQRLFRRFSLCYILHDTDDRLQKLWSVPYYLCPLLS
jgi:hypothetical protein